MHCAFLPCIVTDRYHPLDKQCSTSDKNCVVFLILADFKEIFLEMGFSFPCLVHNEPLEKHQQSLRGLFLSHPKESLKSTLFVYENRLTPP
jgi:hypothetical protein